MDAQERKAELERICRAAMIERNEIDAAERKKELESCVGKFFKYRNCYSCPESPSDYWFLYAAVVRQGERVLWLSFQTDKYGKTEFATQDYLQKLSGYTEISRLEFMAAWKRTTAVWAKFEKQFGRQRSEQ